MPPPPEEGVTLVGVDVPAGMDTIFYTVPED
jgi:hypothetical protein